MSMQQTLAHYQQLAQQHDLSPLSERLLAVTSHTHAMPAGVIQVIQQFPFDAGWLCFQSGIRHYTAIEPIPDNEIVLYGELSRGDTESLHIRPGTGGGWLVSQFREGEGVTYLTEEASLVAEKVGGSLNGKSLPFGFLRYAVYWMHDAEYGYTRTISRFAGYF